MPKEKRRYELRKIKSYGGYNSFADISWWNFTNVTTVSISPGADFGGRDCPPGTVVLCCMTAPEHTAGFAPVTKFSEDGFPIEFGDAYHNPANGRWRAPTSGDEFYKALEEGTPEPMGVFP